MSDPHSSEESARDGGEGRSAVQLEDSPTTRDSDEETEGATGVATDTDASDDASDHEADDEASDDEATSAADDEAGDEAGDRDDVRSEDGATDADDVDDDDDDDADEARTNRTALFASMGVAAVAVIGVLVLLAAFVWPDFTGPGKPDDAATAAVNALGSKDPAKIDQVGCKRLDGKPAAQLPPEALQLIQSVVPGGPVAKSLDTEARQPINLTLSAGGQTQTVPAELVLGVTHGSWCLNGISEQGQ